jgi:hypothetical protein
MITISQIKQRVNTLVFKQKTTDFAELSVAEGVKTASDIIAKEKPPKAAASRHCVIGFR